MWYHNIRRMTKPKKMPAQSKATKQTKKGTHMNESIVTTLPNDSVSAVTVDKQMPSTSAASTASNQTDKSDLILAYLERVDQFNQALTRRVAGLEANKSTSPTTHSIRTQPQVVPPALFSLTHNHCYRLLRSNQCCHYQRVIRLFPLL